MRMEKTHTYSNDIRKQWVNTPFFMKTLQIKRMLCCIGDMDLPFLIVFYYYSVVQSSNHWSTTVIQYPYIMLRRAASFNKILSALEHKDYCI